MRVGIVDRVLDPAALVREVSDPACGAVVLFVGNVRDINDGRAVTGIEYTAYREMAARELTAIVAETTVHFPGVRIAVEHRVGPLALGDASIVIAAAHAHRAPAYDASRYVIEETKRRVPIWKREHYADGARAWVHAGHGPGAMPAPILEPAR
ncbi:MAG: molybdenum cofactor biosynthesis protein MoaE [Gemmatimonadaceae bacterium]